MNGTRTSLRDRLLVCFQSDPEILLFSIYFDAAAQQQHFPAIFPQVYLHYDPRTARELKGKPRIPRQRMDFLLLLPGGVRIVLEIDGQHHYTSEPGIASPSKYAEMVQEDRRLRLAGYDIYRFGGQEFVTDDGGEKAVRAFFRRLFHKHELKGRKSA